MWTCPALIVRLLRSYLRQLCQAGTAGTISKSFLTHVTNGRLDPKLFCDCHAGNCEEIVDMDVPKELTRALVTVFEGKSIAIALAPDVLIKSHESAIIHADNATLIQEVVDEWDREGFTGW